MKAHLNAAKLFRNALRTRTNAAHRNVTGLSSWNEELTPELKHKIEKHWSPRLSNPAYDEADIGREKYYVLSMFPYPSGHLHMGHVRVYTISDSVARFHRMNNRNVIHPIGWDAFGLPAENAAIERNVPPDKWTRENIGHMKEQLRQLGCSFEWHRELSTCNPQYYQWTQELFLKLFEAGLVYQKEAMVNWDPIDKTVLADEQVDENGRSWRSGAQVERKPLKQWFVRTTRFARDLLAGLDDPVLQDWRDIVKIQKHWIGECNGIALHFDLVGRDDSVTLWSATPEYVAHAKFVAVSPSNILVATCSDTAAAPIGTSNTKLLNVRAKNPINGRDLPVYVTDEIQFAEWTDSHIGIPGISESDADFCDKLGIEYAQVRPFVSAKEATVARENLCREFGGYWTSAKLKDWLISRQRYWGTPIPVVHCPNCGARPVNRTDLPVELPKLNKGASQLSEMHDWLNTTCPKCGGPAKRETDTMDTFVDSSWYFLRYLNPDESREMFDVGRAKRMTPVDLYIGGKEHATLHLYYARFVSHFLHSLGLLPEREPFKRLLVQGMVMGRSYRVKGTGQYVPQSEVKVIDAKRNKAVHIETNRPVTMGWEKMSKSKRNGVDPNDMFREYGIDTTRLLILADVAPTSHRNWNSNTFPGILNWQKRLWLTVQQFLQHRTTEPQLISDEELAKHEDYMFDSRNYYVKGATFNYCASQQLSVAISKMQGLTNSLRRMPPAVFARSLQFERALACQLVLLAPIAPHFASELWSCFASAPNRLNEVGEEVQWEKSVLEQRWPEVDHDYKLDLVCQVDGSQKCAVKVARHVIEKLDKEEAFNLAMKQKEMREFLGGNAVSDCSFVMQAGYEGIVNVITERSLSRKAVQG